MRLHTDSALRTLDAAAATLTAGERERARATLERIVATGAAPAFPTPARRSRRRRTLVPAAALALVVASAVVQGLGGDDAAYASWTAVPAPVSDHDLDAVVSACRDQVESYFADPDQARLVLAERRGDRVALLYRTEAPGHLGVLPGAQRTGVEEGRRRRIGGRWQQRTCAGGSPAELHPGRGLVVGGGLDHRRRGGGGGGGRDHPRRHIYGDHIYGDRLRAERPLRRLVAGTGVPQWPPPGHAGKEDLS